VVNTAHEALLLADDIGAENVTSTWTPTT